MCWIGGLWLGWWNPGFLLANDISLVAGQALSVASVAYGVTLCVRRQHDRSDLVFVSVVGLAALAAIMPLLRILVGV